MLILSFRWKTPFANFDRKHRSPHVLKVADYPPRLRTFLKIVLCWAACQCAKTILLIQIIRCTNPAKNLRQTVMLKLVSNLFLYLHVLDQSLEEQSRDLRDRGHGEEDRGRNWWPGQASGKELDKISLLKITGGFFVAFPVSVWVRELWNIKHQEPVV